MTLLLALSFLGAINTYSFCLFGWDKYCATAGFRRVPETELLGLALLGGAAGAIAGQQLFRHKTRKEPFRSSLYTMAAINVVVFAALCVPEVRQMIWNVFESSRYSR